MSGRGATEDSIRVGFVDIDLPTLREMGSSTSTGSLGLQRRRARRGAHERGGIGGRGVEAFAEIVLPTDPAEAETASVRLGEDHDLFAVLGPLAGPTAVVDTWFAGAGETVMIGGNPTPEQLARLAPVAHHR